MSPFTFFALVKSDWANASLVVECDDRIALMTDIARIKNGNVAGLAAKAMVHGMPWMRTDALVNPKMLELLRNMSELAV